MLLFTQANRTLMHLLDFETSSRLVDYPVRNFVVGLSENQTDICGQFYLVTGAEFFYE